ncbi:hypothetical protein GOP47_0018365 [Adiantum capillus-veneris]|uniref:non-specific serine/threonine protein kinase n=1 Tax=Adiantum capillus-veneris TaxID=13818 RepID=A0A9D4ZBI4_ADICA|nr:hypothetical protein GOP47_0018365 [Adiantum capillus-veneris]
MTCLALVILNGFVFVWSFSIMLQTSALSLLHTAALSTTTPSCPLNFTLLDMLVSIHKEVKDSKNNTYRCTCYVQALHFVMVEYLAQTGHFWVPIAAANTCWDAFDNKLSALGHRIDARSECNFTTASLAQASDNCKNITTVQTLEKVVPTNVMSDISARCVNASLEWLSSCSGCTKAIVEASYNYLTAGNTNDTINSCQDLLQIYGASSMATTELRTGVASCLWNLVLHKHHKVTHTKFIFGSAGAIVTLVLCLGLALSFYVRHRMRKVAASKLDLSTRKEKLAKSNSNLQWYTLNEIKAATNNFASSNLLGCGGFGSVYKGVLADGKQVAMKKFKNCTLAGDDDFFHEVEVISSVKHRNLVSVLGCCVDRLDPSGHQRIIVYDYMPNGCLYSHLFTKNTLLDWPTRQNIAIGIVKGLVYLHQEVQPMIIHRDIKSSNILLDAQWNARVADFGLARFTPEGATHVTTRVAGTHGYVAPEYVLYGKLNEKSDVYSLGVLLLELFTRQKMITLSDSLRDPILIADWAWPHIKEGRILDVLDPHMDNLGPLEVVERYVHIALLCSHPQVAFRPTIDQVLRLMETDQPLPVMPDRPPPYTITLSDFNKSACTSTCLSGSSSYQLFCHSDKAR